LAVTVDTAHALLEAHWVPRNIAVNHQPAKLQVDIPGTDKPEYMLDNLQGGRGLLPDAAMRKRIVQYWDSLT
jgi:hypothetical protein